MEYDPDNLLLTEEWTDKNGALLKLETRYPRYPDEQTGNYKLFTYQIKRDESVDETNVDVSSWEKGSEYPHSADVMAKYVGGQWLLFDDSKPKGGKWVVQK